MVEIGHFALVLAFALALVQSALPLAGAWLGDERTRAVGGPVAITGFALIALSFAVLVAAYATSDFSVLNVWENSHSLKPLLYKAPAKPKDTAAAKAAIEGHPLSRVFRELKPMLFEQNSGDTDQLRRLLNLAPAAEHAEELNLRPPSPKKSNDSPPDPAGGEPGPARHPGEADFRLE